MKRCAERGLALILALLIACILSACGSPAQNEDVLPDASGAIQGWHSVPQEGSTDLQAPPEEPVQPDEQTASLQPAQSHAPGIDGELCVRFLDVGQADCALLECGGRYMLIDGGNREDSSLVFSVLKALDVSHLDLVVGTHAHEDHIGGIPGAFQYATAGVTLSPVTSYATATFETFSTAASSRGGGLTVPKVGDIYTLGDAQVTVLGLNGGKETNDTSIVLKVQLGQVSFLFTGDAERNAEEVILAAGADLSSTVLKVGHHGSSSSTSYPFLRQIMPLYAVISVGRDNDYGHPEGEVLDRLEAAETVVLRTDELGDIVFVTDGRTVRYYAGHNAAREPAQVKSGPSQPMQGDVTIHPPAADEQEEHVTPPVSKPEAQSEQTLVQQEKEQPPEPEPVPAEKPIQQVEMVWIPKSGKKYHNHADCSNMKGPSQVTLTQAECAGYTPCKKCY